MSVDVVKILNLRESGAISYHDAEGGWSKINENFNDYCLYITAEILYGFLADGDISWHAAGAHIQFVDTKTKLKINEYTFGAVLKDFSRKITCVSELVSQFKQVTLVAVGVECGVANGMVCILDIFARKVFALSEWYISIVFLVSERRVSVRNERVCLIS